MSSAQHLPGAGASIDASARVAQPAGRGGPVFQRGGPAMGAIIVLAAGRLTIIGLGVGPTYDH